MISWSHSDAAIEKENMERQSELIHILWGYHSDRLVNGHPFALDNSIQSDDPDSRNSEGPLYLATDINRRGIIPFDLLHSMRQGVACSPINAISQRVTASIWDSLNHVTNLSHTTQDSKYDEFINDPDLLKLKEEMDTHGSEIHSFRGSRTIHAGVRVGLDTMCFLSSLQYSLAEDHPFDAPRIARVMGKTTDMKLSLWNMQMTMYKIGVLTDPHKNLVQETSPLGIAPHVLKEHCNKSAIGCPAMQPIGPRAKELLKRHNLYSGVYENHELNPATIMICTAVQKYFKEQIDILMQTLSHEEQVHHIRKTDLDILRGNSSTDRQDPALT